MVKSKKLFLCVSFVGLLAGSASQLISARLLGEPGDGPEITKELHRDPMELTKKLKESEVEFAAVERNFPVMAGGCYKKLDESNEHCKLSKKLGNFYKVCSEKVDYVKTNIPDWVTKDATIGGIITGMLIGGWLSNKYS